MKSWTARSYYFLDRPFTAFELSNAAFAKDPFYAQFLVRVQGERAQRWYFSFSFLAHMGMGYTAFGNGPTANDIGVISESQAFPNSWINGYGRVDGDRAFVGKIFFGYYLSPRLFLSGSIKYRDGDPFAFINAFQRQGQWVITYQTIKAEDEHGKKGGPREDCIWDFNFKLSYDIVAVRQKRPAGAFPVQPAGFRPRIVGKCLFRRSRAPGQRTAAAAQPAARSGSFGTVSRRFSGRCFPSFPGRERKTGERQHFQALGGDLLAAVLAFAVFVLLDSRPGLPRLPLN